MKMNIWKIKYSNCGERYEFMIDHRSYAHNLSSCEVKNWKKFSPERDSNPWQLRYRCSALPTELSSHLGGGHIVNSQYTPILIWFFLNTNSYHVTYHENYFMWLAESRRFIINGKLCGGSRTWTCFKISANYTRHEGKSSFENIFCFTRSVNVQLQVLRRS